MNARDATLTSEKTIRSEVNPGFFRTNREPADGLRHGAGVSRRDGLRKQQAAGKRDDPDEARYYKESPPRGIREHKRAEHRSDGWRDDHHGLDDSKHGLLFSSLVQVFYHGGCNRGSGTAPDRLEDPEEDQVPDVPRYGAGRACGNVQHKPGEQDRTAAVLVGKRPPEEHPEGKEDKEEDQGQVGEVNGNPEVITHAGKGGKVEIGGERDKGGEQCDERDEAPVG